MVTNSNSDNVAKIRAFDCKFLGHFSTGHIPTGIAFDGQSIWIANTGAGSLTHPDLNSNLLGTFVVATSPYGLAIDKSGNLWVSDEGTGNFLKVLNGQVVLVVPAKWLPYLMVSDGTYLWAQTRKVS